MRIRSGQDVQGHLSKYNEDAALDGIFSQDWELRWECHLLSARVYLCNGAGAAACIVQQQHALLWMEVTMEMGSYMECFCHDKQIMVLEEIVFSEVLDSIKQQMLKAVSTLFL